MPKRAALQWSWNHSLAGNTHVSILVVTVGGQENLGNFLHPTEEERQLSLEGAKRQD